MLTFFFSENLVINGYIQTSNGIKLDYHYLDTKKMEDKKKTRRKYTDIQLEIIRNIFETNKTSKKDMCLFLEKNHNIKVSVTTLNKIVNGSY